ncbi:CD109 antigen-like [Paramacrobiotus metropolitanus]|uniref:CD109 antigen-like n=1 Tax=Paramacrobiotus metropolitanus TaxID=2943436 RepID=UPI002445DD8B|nr:CD109 antigen-like [Paramacrobiotus metropolitanus]
MLLKVLSVLTIVAGCVIADDWMNYLIIGPKTVHSNSTFPISILCRNAKSDIHVDVSLRPRKLYEWESLQPDQYASTNSFVIKSDTLSKLEISIPDLSKYPGTGEGFKLSINGNSLSGRFYTTYSWPLYIRELTVAETTNKQLAFVQTDQPLYKATDTVRFRIVTVNEQVLPVHIPLTVRILDPQNNIVKQYTNATDPNVNGYFAGDFLLSTEPLLGAWTIEVSTSDSHDILGTKQFSVDEYVLPRFDVKILSLANFVTPADSSLTFFVEANYTFGEPVKGKLEITWRKGYAGNDLNQNLSIADFNGRSLVTLPVSSPVSSLYNGDSEDDKLEVKVNFTEALTGQSKIAAGSVTFSKKNYKVELLDNADYFLPGQNYQFRVRVSDLDGRPLPPSTKQISIQYSLYDKRGYSGKKIIINKNASLVDTSSDSDGGQTGSQFNQVLTLKVPVNGLLDVDIPTTKDARRISLNIKYIDEEKQVSIKGRESPSASFLNIKQLSKELKSGETANFGINMTTRTNETIQYLVQSISNDSYLWSNSTSDRGSYIVISVPLVEALGPEGRLTVYYIRDDAEVVGNIQLFSLASPAKRTEVTVSAEAKSGLGYAQPGEEALFKAKTSPLSFVAFLAMDESLLLLKAGNDLSSSEVNAAIGKAKPASSPSDMYSVKDYFQDYFENKNPGQFIMTSEHLPSSQEEPIYYDSEEDEVAIASPEILGGPHTGRVIAFSGTGAVAGGDEDNQAQESEPVTSTEAVELTSVAGEASEEKSADNLQSPTQNRKDFRQSFLFETATSNSDGLAEIQSKVPDSVTTWKITAFSLNNSTGLGLTSVPAKLKVFQPFFAVLNLPFSIVRYENLTAEVLVFNYMSQQQDVRVQLEIRNPDNTTVRLNKNIVAKRSEGVTAAFSIIPQQIGDLVLKVTVQSTFAADQLEKTLPVKPEGVKQYYSRPVFIDLRQSSNLNLPLTLPSDPVGIVAGSDKVEVRVVGDILGAAMNNLHKLIRLPTGCGEQNMATTTPNLVVAKYLKQLNQLAEPQKSKLLSNMELGYQRELTYRHTDDSYSAWGNSDPIGSTWLTAYVARVFSEATEFVPIIEDNVIESAMRFLISQQKEDGSFEENGKVIDKQHQGGASSGVALTAFTLLSLFQYQESHDKLWGQLVSSKDKAVVFLESQLSTITNDSYTLAITAYALAKSKSAKSATALDLLEQKMIKNTSAAYWTTVASLSDKGADAEHSYPTNAKDVEATAYALLAFLANNKFSSCLPIVSWLISKQNAEGGFVSTQDTVVGLTALAEFAKAFINPPSMQIDINYDRIKQSMSLTPETSVVLQTMELQNKPKALNMKAQGKGVAIAYLSWTYNVAKPAEDVAFDLNVTKTTSTTDLRMGICSRYIREGKSSMAVIEVNSLSGYQFDEDEVHRLVKTVSTLRKTEIENKETKLNLYFDQLEQTPTCFKLTMYRIYKVKDLKDQSIVVYDYYNPKERRTVSYNL